MCLKGHQREEETVLFWVGGLLPMAARRSPLVRDRVARGLPVRFLHSRGGAHVGGSRTSEFEKGWNRRFWGRQPWKLEMDLLSGNAL